MKIKWLRFLASKLKKERFLKKFSLPIGNITHYYFYQLHQTGSVSDIFYVVRHNNICRLGEDSVINLYSINISLLYPLKTENQRFSDVFSGSRSGALVENGLMTF